MNFSKDPKINDFFEGVHLWDRRFSEFLSAIKRTGSYEKSIIVVISDHGMDLRQAGLYGPDASPNRFILHTPLAIKPLGRGKSRVIRKRTQNVDIFPTIAALADWKLPPEVVAQFDGQSLMDPGYEERPHYFAEQGPTEFMQPLHFTRVHGVYRFDWRSKKYWKLTNEEYKRFRPAFKK